MTNKRQTVIKRYMPPIASFYLIFIGYVLLPMSYIVLSGFYSNHWYELSPEQYSAAAYLGLLITIIFILFFTLGVLSAKFFPKKNSLLRNLNENKPGIIIKTYGKFEPINFKIHSYNIIFIVTVVSSIFIWISFAGGGYKKILLLGQNIDMLDFRLLGGDGNRIVTALLQIARRLTLPFGIIYIYLLSKHTELFGKKMLYYLYFTLFIGVITTLDRAPLMMILIMIFYIQYCSIKKLQKLFIIVPILILSIIVFSGSATFIQYNIQDYDFIDIIETGMNFMGNRAILAPNFVPIELSYGIFDFDSDKLLLKFSRITALITGEYVGSTEKASLYVGPVGAIADIWRNTGIIGIIVISYFLGIYFSVINLMVKNSDPITQVAMSFTIISLLFYFIYGTFFSQGIFLQLIFIYFVLKLLKRDGFKRYN